MSKIQNIVAILILVIIAWGAYSIVTSFQHTADAAFAPVSALSTQASKLLNPTPTVIPDPITIIHEVRSLARLETIYYSMEKVITAETNQGAWGFLVGDKLLFVAHGDVIAGVDLAKLEPEDLEARQGVLYVQLPEAEVFVATLDNEKSYVYDRDTGLFAQDVKDLETAARRSAEEEILKAALEDGILEQAQINAENFLIRLLRDLGYEEVIFLNPEPNE
jgi:hypothetical protein